MATLTEQLSTIAQRNRQRVSEVVIRSVIAAGDEIVSNSPVGHWGQWTQSSQRRRPMPPYVPGRFKGSWQYGANHAPMMDVATIDASGDTSRARIRPGEAFVVHNIVNNSPYARILEENRHPTIAEWHLIDSQEAHVIDNTRLAFKFIVANVAREVAAK